MTDAAELKPPSAEEALETDRLVSWLRDRLPGADGVPEVWRFSGGHANLTYLLRFGTVEYVLRRPPLGPVPPGAHDMAREHRVLSRLGTAFPLAPRSFFLCDDAEVIGAPFIVAERRRGMSVPGPDLPPALQGDPKLARRLGEALVGALADLHRVDPAAVGLETLGQPEGFVARQLAGWSRRWEAALDRPRPGTETTLRVLQERLPRSGRVSLLHNDYKLDNILLDPADPARPVAVLDWDMCTRGDPLMDLGYLLNYWTEPDDPAEFRAAASMPTWRPGFPSREEAVLLYVAQTGFDVSSLGWYRAFAAFKLAVILQQIYARYLRGQTTDPRFAGFGGRVDALLAKAERLVEAG